MAARFGSGLLGPGLPVAGRGCDRVIWRGWPGSGRPGRLRGGFYPPAIASCRAIGLRCTSAAAQLACSVALSVPMYRLLRAP